MKMVKSLLLGSAAGLVAMAGAQAADLPVKAKPVQYVKICSLYGAGFYYIPGTDTCLKIGGFVRAEMNFYANGSFYAYTAANFDSPATNVENTRVRFGITADARSQTAYGTLRAFVYMAPTETNGLGGGYNAVYSPAGFIQWAGFTFGLTQLVLQLRRPGLHQRHVVGRFGLRWPRCAAVRLYRPVRQWSVGHAVSGRHHRA